MPEETAPQTNETAEDTEVYDNRSYVIHITFTGPVTNLHIEQYGKPISVPPPPPGGN